MYTIKYYNLQPIRRNYLAFVVEILLKVNNRHTEIGLINLLIMTWVVNWIQKACEYLENVEDKKCVTQSA